MVSYQNISSNAKPTTPPSSPSHLLSLLIRSTRLRPPNALDGEFEPFAHHRVPVLARLPSAPPVNTLSRMIHAPPHPTPHAPLSHTHRVPRLTLTSLPTRPAISAQLGMTFGWSNWNITQSSSADQAAARPLGRPRGLPPRLGLWTESLLSFLFFLVGVWPKSDSESE